MLLLRLSLLIRRKRSYSYTDKVTTDWRKERAFNIRKLPARSDCLTHTARHFLMHRFWILFTYLLSIYFGMKFWVKDIQLQQILPSNFPKEVVVSIYNQKYLQEFSIALYLCHYLVLQSLKSLVILVGISHMFCISFIQIIFIQIFFKLCFQVPCAFLQMGYLWFSQLFVGALYSKYKLF